MNITFFTAYVFAFCVSSILSPKAFNFANSGNLSSPITWGDIFFSVAIGLLPIGNFVLLIVAISFWITYAVYYISCRKWANTKVFPLFKRKK